MRSPAILLIVTALSSGLSPGFLASARAAVGFPQGNAIAFNPPSLNAGEGTIQSGQPTLNPRGDGYEIVDFSYTVTADRVGPIDVVWSASRNFNLDSRSNLTLRIKGDARISLPANNTVGLTVNGYVSGILPANLSFTSGDINGPQSPMDITWDKAGEPILRDAGNDQSLQMDFGIHWMPRAIGDQITISARSEIRIIEAGVVGVLDPGAVVAVRAAPNPSPGPVQFAVALPTRARVQLGMYDLRGRPIAILIDRMLDPGSHMVEWAATDAAGRRLVPGLYLFRLIAGTRVQRGKVVLLD